MLRDYSRWLIRFVVIVVILWGCSYGLLFLGRDDIGVRADSELVKVSSALFFVLNIPVLIIAHDPEIFNADMDYLRKMILLDALIYALPLSFFFGQLKYITQRKIRRSVE